MKFVLLLAAFAADPTSAFTAGLLKGSAVSPSSSRKSFKLNAAADGVANGTDKKKIIVLGGDGFCGWPTSLYLSDQGHDVVIVDNLSRRNIDTELGCDSLTPIQPPGVSFWRGSPPPSLFVFSFSSPAGRSPTSGGIILACTKRFRLLFFLLLLRRRAFLHSVGWFPLCFVEIPAR